MAAPINVLVFTWWLYQQETSRLSKALEHLNMRSDTVKIAINHEEIPRGQTSCALFEAKLL